MAKISIVYLLFFTASLGACKEKNIKSTAVTKDKTAQPYSFHLNKLDVDKVNWKEKDLKYWKKVLTDIQIEVCREEGTERAFTGQYDKFYEVGTYVCSSCGLPLFHSKTKYDSKTGWPSFYQPINKSAVKEKDDFKFGIKRTEIVCSRCDAHLGHVFTDGPPPTGLRYCMNSVCLLYKKPKK